MKKNLFLLGILAMGAGMFTSCDDIDDVDINDSKTEVPTLKKKRLVSITEYKGEDSTTSTFEYDMNGMLTDVVSSDPDPYIKGTVFNYTRMRNRSSSGINGGTKSIRIIIHTTEFNSNGFIANIIDKHIDTTDYANDTTLIGESIVSKKYNYDGYGHLTSLDYIDVLGIEHTYIWTWEDGNIKKYEDITVHADSLSPKEFNWVYEYTNNDSPTLIENKTDLLFNCGLPYYNLFGLSSKYLPVSIINGDNGIEHRIEWTLDNDGYPVKAVMYWADNNKKNQYIEQTIKTINFVWE